MRRTAHTLPRSNPGKQRGNIFSRLLVGIVFISIPLGFGWLMVGEPLRQRYLVSDWVETPAFILETKLLESRGSGRDSATTYETAARYSYRFAGKQYEADKVSLYPGGDNAGGFHQHVYRELSEFQKNGRPFPCYVNPDNPRQAVLYRDIRWGMTLFVGLIVIAFCGGGVLFIVQSIRESFFAKRRAETGNARQTPEDASYEAAFQAFHDILPKMKDPQFRQTLKQTINEAQDKQAIKIPSVKSLLLWAVGIYVGFSILTSWLDSPAPKSPMPATEKPLAAPSQAVSAPISESEPAPQATPLQAASVREGNALSLDGVDDHVVLPEATWFNRDLTIEAWVYPRSYNNWSRLLDVGNGANADNVLVALSKGKSGKGTRETVVDSPTTLPLNTWSHLAATLSGTTGVLYIDGEEVARNPDMNIPRDLVRKQAYIGRSNWTQDAYADAVFDELRIWNVARSSAQIKEAMHGTLSGSEAGLLAYYRFDQSGGEQVADLTGNGYDGNVQGEPEWVSAEVME